jgi:hypothetical protein
MAELKSTRGTLDHDHLLALINDGLRIGDERQKAQRGREC